MSGTAPAVERWTRRSILSVALCAA
ncbi:MAG: hypothetical protein QOJ54_2839, partial [Aliidongia sp.]|nr:hypothetical protein [Aliidongia sp.]